MAYMILKKVLSIIPLLLLVSVILFVLINLLPGDAAMGMVTEGASEDYVNRVRAEMGLDKPPVTRYFDWLIGIFRGDLGKSLISNQLVSVKIAQRLPVTLEITFVAMVISILIAVPLGILSAVRRGSIFDTIGSFVSMLGIAMPPFWLGMLLVLLFSVTLNALPASGFVSFAARPAAKPALRDHAGCQHRRGLCRYRDAADALGAAGGYAAGLCDHCLRQGPQRAGCYLEACAAKRADSRRHRNHNANRPSHWRCGRYGNGFCPSGHRQGDRGRHSFQRLPRCHGDDLVVAALVVVTNTLVDVLYILIDPRISTASKS